MIEHHRDVFDIRTAQPVEAHERREGKRHALVLLIGRVFRDEGESACLVRDLSSGGLMACFAVAPRLHETLRIEIRGLDPTAGVVRWVQGVNAGVEFETPQNIDRVFNVKGDDGWIARTPRFPVEGPAMLRVGMQTMGVAASLVDISPGGAKLACSSDVKQGQTGQLRLRDTGTTLYGTICWAHDGECGFRFVTPLPLTTLSQILGVPHTGL